MERSNGTGSPTAAAAAAAAAVEDGQRQLLEMSPPDYIFENQFMKGRY